MVPHGCQQAACLLADAEIRFLHPELRGQELRFAESFTR
jgi:hypothetical protein